MAKNKITFEEFSARVEKAYNGRISVVKETYVNTRHKVTAYCKVHKIYFEVGEARALTRHFVECPKCIKEKIKKIRENSRTPWEKVLKRFRDKYGDKFTYDETTYNGTKHEMKVRCNDCGSEFEITPAHHLKYNRGGCPICHKHKIRKCSKCGKEFEVDIHFADSVEFICKECKKEINRNKNKEKRLNSKKSLIPRKRKSKYNSQEERQRYKLERRRELTRNKLYTCPCCGQTHKYKEKCQTHELCQRHPNPNWYKNLIPFGFDYSKIGTPEYVDEYYKAIEVIKTEYFVNKLSSRLIFEKYNCKEYFKYESVIRNIFKTEHIIIRNLHEAQNNAIYTGALKLNFYPLKFNIEHHTSWNNKIFLLRSSYESDYAKILDELEIDYEVETLKIHYYDTQKLKERIAVPDFYLPETNTIVEIKSTFTLDVQNMKDKVVAYIAAGYKFKLILEHKECDLNELTLTKNNEKYKAFVNKYKIRRKTKVGHNQRFRWMHNNVERIQVALDEIERYQQMGWILGALTPQLQKENIANGVQPCAKLLDISEDN